MHSILKVSKNDKALKMAIIAELLLSTKKIINFLDNFKMQSHDQK